MKSEVDKTFEESILEKLEREAKNGLSKSPKQHLLNSESINSTSIPLEVLEREKGDNNE